MKSSITANTNDKKSKKRRYKKNDDSFLKEEKVFTLKTLSFLLIQLKKRFKIF